MNWEDEGFLISKTKFRENANIINVFTSKFGKMSGIVYGGNSRKVRNFLQISNKIFVIYNSKNDNKFGYYKTELITPIAPKYFSDKKRTSALLSISSILNILLPESQPHKNIYESLCNFINNLNSENWFLFYVFWELNIIKELGFGLNLEQFKNKISSDNYLTQIEIDGDFYQIPNFLINKEIPKNINAKLIGKSLGFLRILMMNKFFIPNNLIFPKSRIIFENYFN